jgi:hypothetical protein
MLRLDGISIFFIPRWMRDAGLISSDAGIIITWFTLSYPYWGKNELRIY